MHQYVNGFANSETVAEPVSAPPGHLRMQRLVALFTFWILVSFGLLNAPWIKPLVRAFTRSLVSLSAAIITLAGGSAVVNDDVIQSPANGFAIRMLNGCNGAHVTIVLWSAVLAFPASFKLKVEGLLAAALAVHSLNLVRFISLFYVGQYAPAWFDFAHVYLWESLIMMDALVVFWFWVHYVLRSDARSHAER